MPSAAALERTVVELLATLPDLPLDSLAPLAAAYRALAAGSPATPPIAMLAHSIAALLDRYRDRAAPLEGFALLASAAHTLTRALASDADHSAAIAASRFEIDSLAAPLAMAPSVGAPDVPATALRRRS